MEKLIHWMLDLCWEPLYKTLVYFISKSEQRQKGIVAADFPEAIGLVDVTFQPCWPPKGIFGESKIYFSGKHYNYGVKTEILHAPNGLPMFVSTHSPGSRHDFAIFQSNLPVYEQLVAKQDNDRTLADPAATNLPAKYKKQWALIFDFKGYVGAEKSIRSILCHKGKQLSAVQKQYNKKVRRNRVACENFYGRMKTLWRVTAVRFRWDHVYYDKIMKLCGSYCISCPN